jgi:branched-subunit amino acid permease
MDSEFVDEYDHDLNTRHSVNNDYQQGYSDAVHDTIRELWLSYLFVFLILIIVCYSGAIHDTIRKLWLSYLFVFLILIIVCVRFMRPRQYRDL